MTCAHKLYHGDCLEILKELDPVQCIVADPPDGIGLKYNSYDDRTPADRYVAWLRRCLSVFLEKARVVWVSYNARWTFEIGRLVCEILESPGGSHIEAKPCIQAFTFGQHNHNDLGNCHRPLLRLRWKDAPLYPDAIRVPSWRQLNGDKRADPRGRVPGDVFDFPRVTGNSKQRRAWHATPNTEQQGGWEISLDATSTFVLNAVGKVLQAVAGRWLHFPERSLGCRTKTGSPGNRL